MKKLALILSVIALISFTSCTKNQMAKSYGAKMTIELEPSTKLVNATWKDSDLWVLTRPMKADEKPETYKFSEKSTYGIWEGQITFVEVK